MTGDNWNSISDDAKDLISKLLKKNVHKRLSASQAYSHPWIQKYHKDLTSEDPIISTLSSIKSFRASNKLKYAIKTFILCQVMSPHELESLQKAFNAIDTNGDGVISKIELYNQLKLTMSEDEAKAESERILQNVDTDLNGVIDYTEFLHATVEKKKMLTKTNLHKAFMMFDNDESGVIEVNEVRR